MVGISLLNSVRQDKEAISRRPMVAVLLALAMVGLAAGHLLVIIPAFARLADSPFFQIFKETNEMLALMVALYAAYRLHPAMGMGAILVFMTVLLPYFALVFPKDFPGLFRLLLVALMTLLGIRLIAELRRAVELMQRREREISALAEFNSRSNNERIQFQEEATRKGEKLAQLQQAVRVTSQASTPLEASRQLLPAVQETVRAEYASFTLVAYDGTLGQRVDSFCGIEPLKLNHGPQGLEDAVLQSRAPLYIPDAKTDPRVNPDLVAAGFRSCLGLPLRTNGRVGGILFLHSTRTHAFGDERDFLESVAGLLAVQCSREISVPMKEAVRQ